MIRHAAAAVTLACAVFAVVIGITASPAAASRDDRAAVCEATATTVVNGLDGFVADMEAVSTHAGRGDLVAAEKSVRDAGAKLVNIGAQLRQDGAKADDPRLRATVADLAREFESLGRSLTDLKSLQTFNPARLDQLAATMTELCGESPPPPPPQSPGPAPAG